MKPMILASILALTALAWTTQASVACEYCAMGKHGWSDSVCEGKMPVIVGRMAAAPRS
jgi:hypothetical protein